MKDMKTNFIGPVNVTNALLPHMRLRRDGTIVFIGSRSAYRSGIVVSLFSLFLVSRLTWCAVQGLGMHLSHRMERGLKLQLKLRLRLASYSASKAAMHSKRHG